MKVQETAVELWGAQERALCGGAHIGWTRPERPSTGHGGVGAGWTQRLGHSEYCVVLHHAGTLSFRSVSRSSENHVIRCKKAKPKDSGKEGCAAGAPITCFIRPELGCGWGCVSNLLNPRERRIHWGVESSHRRSAP